MNKTPDSFLLGLEGGLQIALSDFGARWLSCRVPLADGSRREVLLGHESPSAHRHERGFLGAIVGRYANRIGGSAFELDGVRHQLTPNEGRNQLHGGPEGFDKRFWTVVEREPCLLRLRLHSPDGDQGYPGGLEAEVSYRVDPARQAVHISFSATVSAPCPVSLASHAYFNLDGDARSVLDHQLCLAAARMLPVDGAGLPLGHADEVAGTRFDFRSSRRVAGAYDHCFVLDDQPGAPAAELRSGDGLLALQLFTDYPGLQVYSGAHLAEAKGRDGRPFAPHAGIALEPQFFPDAPNHPLWREQGCILRPGERLERFMTVVFSSPAA